MSKVFVGNLNYQTSEEKLRQEFEKIGKVEKVNIVRLYSGKSRGYGFVEFVDADSAAKAKESEIEIDERKVNVELPKPREGGSRPRRNYRGYRRGRYRGYGRGRYYGRRFRRVETPLSEKCLFLKGFTKPVTKEYIQGTVLKGYDIVEVRIVEKKFPYAFADCKDKETMEKCLKEIDGKTFDDYGQITCKQARITYNEYIKSRNKETPSS